MGKPCIHCFIRHTCHPSGPASALWPQRHLPGRCCHNSEIHGLLRFHRPCRAGYPFSAFIVMYQAGKLRRTVTVSRKDSGHFMIFSLFILKPPVQIHKSPHSAITGIPFSTAFYCPAHGTIFFQSVRIQLRISSVQYQGIRLFRKSAVMKRAETGDFTAETSQ